MLGITPSSWKSLCSNMLTTRVLFDSNLAYAYDVYISWSWKCERLVKFGLPVSAFAHMGTGDGQRARSSRARSVEPLSEQRGQRPGRGFVAAPSTVSLSGLSLRSPHLAVRTGKVFACIRHINGVPIYVYTGFCIFRHSLCRSRQFLLVDRQVARKLRQWLRLCSNM